MTETQGRMPIEEPSAADDWRIRAGITEDAFLGGKLKVLQPRRGYRAGTDAVMLAAAVAADAGESVLDIGAGVGVASLCLARRLTELKVTAFELQAANVELLSENCRRNGLQDQIEVVQGDLMAPPRSVKNRAWDQVMINPPFYDRDKASEASEPSKTIAHLNNEAHLSDWIDFALKRLKPRGRLTLIHRIECLDDIIVCLKGRAGALKVLPVWPRRDKLAKRVIVAATKDSMTPLILLPGIVMHEYERRYSEAAESVLRRGEALKL